MQITERSTLGRPFERRLRAALDRIVPPTPHFAGARYRSMILPGRSGRIWRLAPALVGIAAIGIMATSATVATGSTNPAVWTQKAESTIKSVRHIAQSKPGPVQSPKPKPSQGAPSSQQSGANHPANSSGGTQTPHYTRGGSAGGALWRAWRPRSPTMVQGENMRIFSPVPTLRKTIIWRHMRFRLWPA